MYFDLNTALKALGEGVDPIDAFGMSFGVPTCLMQLGKNAAAALIPTPILLNIADQVEAGREAASEDIAKLKKKILFNNSLYEFDTETGTFRFKSDSSKNGLDNNVLDAVGKLGGLTSSVAYALQYGSELYTNYLGAANQLVGVKDCIDSYKNFLSYQKGPSNEILKVLDPLDLENAFSLEMSRMNDALGFINNANEVLKNIRGIVAQRRQNPSLEPVFTSGVLPPGTGLNESETTNVNTDPIFRLVFGPPKSKTGQFLLSVDGLYYDSQSGGLPEVSGFVAPQEFYRFEQAANIGGRGDIVTSRDLNKYIDTIFDPDIIDDSIGIQPHYEEDHFLSVLVGQRNKHIYDLSSQVVKYHDEGYSDESAMIFNLKQSIIGINAIHENKINKRKKQIEVAVKAPTIFGKDTGFAFGKIPVNDFSFLKGLNLAVALDKQKRLIFNQGEVSGVILPLRPKYVTAQEAEGQIYMDHLVVPNVGKGSIILATSAAASANMILSLTDGITTDHLIAIYNYLESDVTMPNSDEFSVLNCATENQYNSAQLVAKNSNLVFTSGLAIPFLEGICKFGSVVGNAVVSSLGSYVRLPDTIEFQDLTYKNKGFTFETWALVPGIMSQPGTGTPNYEPISGWSNVSFNRILLGCENFGGSYGALDQTTGTAPADFGSNNVRGLLVGFSRDRQVTTGQAPAGGTNNNSVNDTVFYIAPTRSYNTSNIGYLSLTNDFCTPSSYNIRKCAVTLSSTMANGFRPSSVGTEFVHFAVTVSPEENTVKIFIEGELATTSSIPDVFGVPAFTSPKLPSPYLSNSFEYSSSSTNYRTADLANGPKLNSFLTPWVIGGGWSDGAETWNWHMGNIATRRSGLRGHVGSTKFYSKALNTDEVRQNYNAQKAFFKNIDT